jgi:hypothetical protein
MKCHVFFGLFIALEINNKRIIMVYSKELLKNFKCCKILMLSLSNISLYKLFYKVCCIIKFDLKKVLIFIIWKVKGVCCNIAIIFDLLRKLAINPVQFKYVNYILEHTRILFRRNIKYRPYRAMHKLVHMTVHYLKVHT